MKRLFIDCDDTLVLYDTGGEIHPYGWILEEAYRVNTPLVDFIHRFRDKYPGALIVIWSGGGSSYARTITRALGLEELEVVPMLKDQTTFGMVREDDLVVDDQPIAVPVVVISPKDYQQLEQGL